MKPAVTITVVFLLLIALLHLARLVFGIAVTVDGAAVPMLASVAGCVVPGALAAWLWSEQRSAGRPAG